MLVRQSVQYILFMKLILLNSQHFFEYGYSVSIYFVRNRQRLHFLLSPKHTIITMKHYHKHPCLSWEKTSICHGKYTMLYLHNFSFWTPTRTDKTHQVCDSASSSWHRYCLVLPAEQSRWVAVSSTDLLRSIVEEACTKLKCSIV